MRRLMGRAYDVSSQRYILWDDESLSSSRTRPSMQVHWEEGSFNFLAISGGEEIREFEVFLKV